MFLFQGLYYFIFTISTTSLSLSLWALRKCCSKSSVFSCIHSFTLPLKPKLSNISYNWGGITAAIPAARLIAVVSLFQLCLRALFMRIKPAKCRFKLLHKCVNVLCMRS